MKLFTARTAILAALLFATAMTALSQGGWWWAILAATVLWLTGVRLPFLRFGLTSTHRYIMAENRRTRRENRRIVRRRRKAQKMLRKMQRTRQ